MVVNMRNSRDTYEETCDFVGDLRPSTSNKWRFDWPWVGCLSMFIPVGFVRKWSISPQRIANLARKRWEMIEHCRQNMTKANWWYEQAKRHWIGLRQYFQYLQETLLFDGKDLSSLLIEPQHREDGNQQKCRHHHQTCRYSDMHPSKIGTLLKKQRYY